MKWKMSRKLIISAAVLAALILLIQLVPVEQTNPPVEADLVAPAPVKDILRRACYDCHSHETRWPWYGRVAPFSWWLAEHVTDGRADLNFSRWPIFDFEARELMLRDIEKQLMDGTMPLGSYVLGHREARLSDRDREVLLEWVRAGS
ncbi:MAG: heme-binding domain-containing protein [Candidatus Krumholzibacteria bacterium]|nr:heme-binding domain-containing protein [Candidatus Krumholzibacteria bacterium]